MGTVTDLSRLLRLLYLWLGQPYGHRQLAVGCVGWCGVAPIPTELPSYRGYRDPAKIISYAVWLYYHFSLSLRDVEELLAERGVTVTCETSRAWCTKFGPSYAAGLRRGRATPE